MKKFIPCLAIICIAIIFIIMNCGIAFNPRGAPPVNIYNRQVDVLDAFCTYGEASEFPFRFALKNLNNKDTEVSYTWTLTDPMADKPLYEGQGNILLPASGEKEIEIQVKQKMEYDPRFFVMSVYVYRDDKQVGYYRGQKSTYDWDYSIVPPVKRTGKPSYKHVWIDTFIEKTQSGYRVNIGSIIFLPPERTTRLNLNNICVSGGFLLSDILTENIAPDDMIFHDADNNGELTVGDYLSMNNSAGGKTIEFDSRDEPSLRINKVGYRSETIEVENRDAISIKSVEYKIIDGTALELEVEVYSEKSLEHVDAKFYSPGEGGVSSSSYHLEPPISEGETLVYRKVINTFPQEKSGQYLLIYVTDGTNEVIYNAGKLP